MNKKTKEETIDFERDFKIALMKEFCRIKQMNNRELRKYIENSNWNNILQIIRFLQDEIEQLQKENEQLKEQLENNSKINIADHKYASEIEDKYLIEHNILIEFENWLGNKLETTYANNDMAKGYKNALSISLDKLEELKEVDK